MPRTIVLIQGHPHSDQRHFCHALAQAYAEGAEDGGHTLTRFDIGAMDIPFLRDPKDFATPAPAPVKAVQDAVLSAGHIVVVYPLWLGTMPALVKAFFEHFARADFAIEQNERGWPRKMLKGRSARVIVTMGMPAAAYRLAFGAHGVKGFETGILGMAGIDPIHETFVGGVEAEGDKGRREWLDKLRALGRRGD
jgi:putative NADPH-quinone reductase